MEKADRPHGDGVRVNFFHFSEVQFEEAEERVHISWEFVKAERLVLVQYLATAKVNQRS